MSQDPTEERQPSGELPVNQDDPDQEVVEQEELDQEDLAELVSDLLVQISRTQLAAKLYTTSNKARLKAFDLLIERLRAALEHIDPLLVAFEQDQITWEGIAVYDPREHAQSFATRLFREGVRQLAITSGISDDELEQFVDLLGPAQSSERDIVDMLWEAQFEHIAHVAVDGFTERAGEADDDQGKESSRAAPRFHRVVEILTGLKGNGTPATAPPVPIDFGTQMIEPLELAVRSAAPVDARARWSEELKVLNDSQLVQIIDEYIVSLFSGQAAGFSLVDVVGLATGLILQRLTDSQFDEARATLVRLAPHTRHSPEHAAVIHEIQVRIGSIQTLDFVCEKDGPLRDADSAEAAARFFRKHANFTDAELLARVEQPYHGPALELVSGLLAERVRAQPSEWAQVVQRIDGAILEIVLRSVTSEVLATDAILSFFWAAFDHPAPACVAVAIELYRGEWEDRFRDRMLQEMTSPHLAVRCSVLKQIGASGDQSLGIYLLNRARKEGLMAIQAEELELLLIGLVRLGGERYLPFLRKQLEEFGVVKGTLLLTRDVKTLIRINHETRVVLMAVAEVGTPVAVDLLREVRKTSRGKLKEFVDDLWRKTVARFAEGVRHESAEYSATVEEEHTSGMFERIPSQQRVPSPAAEEDQVWDEVREILEKPISSPNLAVPEGPQPDDWRYSGGGLFGRIGSEPKRASTDSSPAVPGIPTDPLLASPETDFSALDSGYQLAVAEHEDPSWRSIAVEESQEFDIPDQAEEENLDFDIPGRIEDLNETVPGDVPEEYKRITAEQERIEKPNETTPSGVSMRLPGVPVQETEKETQSSDHGVATEPPKRLWQRTPSSVIRVKTGEPAPGAGVLKKPRSGKHKSPGKRGNNGE